MKLNKIPKLLTIGLIVIILNLVAFAQIDVPRKTVAVTYPLNEEVLVAFRGTTRFPRLKGTATVKRANKTGTKIELNLQNVPRPYELGEAYTTFVLWAVTPEGQASNLGEIKRRSLTWVFDTKIQVTTPFQTFALIVTAEPHFLVKQPSKAVILENLSPNGIVATTVDVAYFGNSSDFFRDARVPEIADPDYVKTPVSLLGARQAISLAKYAGAARDAEEEFNNAVKALQNAENAWRGGAKDPEVDLQARQAIAAGVKAEETAILRKDARLKREEKLRRDAELRKAEEKTEDIQQELVDARAELQREQQSRQLVEKDVENLSNQITDLRLSNQNLKDELAQVRKEAEDAKLQLARIEGEKQVLDKQRQAEEKQRAEEDRITRIRTNSYAVVQSLKQFGTVKEDGRGIVLVLPESIWTGTRISSFTPVADPKIDNLAQFLIANPDYHVSIESHTDNTGNPDDLQNLTNARAQAIAEKFAAAGIAANRIDSRGLGASIPIAPNKTAASKAKNRRVELILTIQPNTTEGN